MSYVDFKELNVNCLGLDCSISVFLKSSRPRVMGGYTMGVDPGCGPLKSTQRYSTF